LLVLGAGGGGGGAGRFFLGGFRGNDPPADDDAPSTCISGCEEPLDGELLRVCCREEVIDDIDWRGIVLVLAEGARLGAELYVGSD
jgi:hypothetical protein